MHWFLETYGWRCVFLGVFSYYLYCYVCILWEDFKRRKSLLEATNPHRVAVLNKERVRVRDSQQEEQDRLDPPPKRKPRPVDPWRGTGGLNRPAHIRTIPRRRCAPGG
jgi:hypothetical protein